MKQKQFYQSLLGFVLLSSLFYCCKKNSTSPPVVVNNATMVLPDRPTQNFTPGLKASKSNVSNEIPLAEYTGGLRTHVNSLTERSATCGGSLNGSWGGSGYHQYTKDTLYFDSSRNGRTISIAVNANSVPNRFTVYNGVTGSIVAASPWMGFASYSGPWGPSLNTSQTGTLTFTKESNTSYYLLLVETSVNGTSDAYSTTITCL
jgi:hypothetical protein